MGQGHVDISFHVDIENEIPCHEPGISAVFFRLRKTSGTENESPSWTFSEIQVTIYQAKDAAIHRHYVLNYRIFYDQCTLSPQSLSAKSIYFLY